MAARHRSPHVRPAARSPARSALAVVRQAVSVAGRRRSSSPKAVAAGMPQGVAAGVGGTGPVRRLEPLRPPGADDRRVRDHRQVRRTSGASPGRPRSRRTDFTARTVLHADCRAASAIFYRVAVPGSRRSSRRSAGPRSAASSPRPLRRRSVTSPSPGRPTRSVRAGASIPNGAGCGSTKRCGRRSRTSSSTPATRSTPTSRSRPR